mgnify:CR=1 FL=1
MSDHFFLRKKITTTTKPKKKAKLSLHRLTFLWSMCKVTRRSFKAVKTTTIITQFYDILHKSSMGAKLVTLKMERFILKG